MFTPQDRLIFNSNLLNNCGSDCGCTECKDTYGSSMKKKKRKKSKKMVMSSESMETNSSCPVSNAKKAAKKASKGAGGSNCGIGSGGFMPGNKCAAGGGGSAGAKKSTTKSSSSGKMTADQAKKAARATQVTKLNRSEIGRLKKLHNGEHTAKDLALSLGGRDMVAGALAAGHIKKLPNGNFVKKGYKPAGPTKSLTPDAVSKYKKAQADLDDAYYRSDSDSLHAHLTDKERSDPAKVKSHFAQAKKDAAAAKKTLTSLEKKMGIEDVSSFLADMNLDMTPDNTRISSRVSKTSKRFALKSPQGYAEVTKEELRKAGIDADKFVSVLSAFSGKKSTTPTKKPSGRKSSTRSLSDVVRMEDTHDVASSLASKLKGTEVNTRNDKFKMFGKDNDEDVSTFSVKTSNNRSAFTARKKIQSQLEKNGFRLSESSVDGDFYSQKLGNDSVSIKVTPDYFETRGGSLSARRLGVKVTKLKDAYTVHDFQENPNSKEVSLFKY